MQEKHTNTQERTDQIREFTSRIEYQDLGEDSVTCQICKRELREGSTVTVYAYRAAGTTGFDVGYTMCGADTHAHPSEFIRGVHELIVTGRIGQCTDVVTQSSWLVLLAPEPVIESHPASTDIHAINDRTTRPSRDTSRVEVSREEYLTQQDDVEVGSPMDANSRSHHGNTPTEEYR